MAISKRHKSFIDEYLINGLNGAQAYIKIYPDVEEENARSSASRLLTNDNVIEYLEKEQAIINNRSRKSKDDKLRIAEEIMDAKAERSTDRLKAIEVHNKMTGDNEPEKLNVTGDTTINYINPKK